MLQFCHLTRYFSISGLPRAYNKDLQEDKEALFDSVSTVQDCLSILLGMCIYLLLYIYTCSIPKPIPISILISIPIPIPYP
ncbi:hypothetical protein EON63_21355 [archaeon]|nr:MAG: hypothetical protein EON63_21355 [archaeon]